MENSILFLISVDILKHCQPSFQPTKQFVHNTLNMKLRHNVTKIPANLKIFFYYNYFKSVFNRDNGQYMTAPELATQLNYILCPRAGRKFKCYN